MMKIGNKGGNALIFFYANCLLTSCGGCAIIARRVLGHSAPNFSKVNPYGNFSKAKVEIFTYQKFSRKSSRFNK